VCRRDVQGELLDQPRQSRSLSLWKLQHQAGQGRGVDDGMFERALQSTADEPGVEGVVAVLDQDRAVSEAQEGPTRVSKLRCPNEHGSIDVMAPVGVRVDRRLAVDKGVEERQRSVKPEALRTDLEHQEWRVTRRLDVQGDELSLIEPRVRADLGSVDRNLLPGDRFHGSARLEKNRF
jgi:hypothetical protein